MRNSLYNDDFENYLENQVKQHRIYPSDHIWRNIQTSLHGEKSWPALTIISIIIIAALTAGTILISPNSASLSQSYHPATPVTKLLAERQSARASEAMEKHLSADNLTEQTIVSVSEKLGIPTPVITQINTGYLAQNHFDNITPDLSAIDLVNENPPIRQTEPVAGVAAVSAKIVSLSVNAAKTSSVYSPEFSTLSEVYSLAQPVFRITAATVTVKNIVSPVNSNPSEIWRDFPLTNKPAGELKTSRFSFQAYISPAASYRRVTQVPDEQPALTASLTNRSITPVTQPDPVKLQHTSPALGMEAGFAIGYRLNRQITLRSGLQFNLLQYNTAAYSYKNSFLALRFPSPSLPDSSGNAGMMASTYPSGAFPVTLLNRYFELSVPISLDWQVISRGKFALTVAGSVQPTYTFQSDVFVLSPDNKFYLDGSAGVHKWNINTSLETYLSYHLGDYTWQIGPQIRYQQFPTFKNSYPGKEYLMSYGIKLGFSKAIK